MNILNNPARLNNVVFENRNKNYGAYAIRSEYNESIRKALFCVGSFVLLLFGSSFAYHKLHVEPTEKSTFIADDLNKNIVVEIDMRQPKAPEEQPQPNDAAAAKGGIATVINNNAVETQSTNVQNPNSGQGDPGSSGTSLTSTVSSTEPSTITINGGSEEKKIMEVIIAEEMPEFSADPNGLLKFVASNVSYPDLAREIGKEGTVYVSFVVNEFGNVENPKILRGIGYGCDEEVIRVISKMPKWRKPGKQSGQPVKVRFN